PSSAQAAASCHHSALGNKGIAAAALSNCRLLIEDAINALASRWRNSLRVVCGFRKVPRAASVEKEATWHKHCTLREILTPRCGKRRENHASFPIMPISEGPVIRTNTHETAKSLGKQRSPAVRKSRKVQHKQRTQEKC